MFLGWRMVAVAFFVDFIAVGFFFYSYGVFFKAIAMEFGDSRLGVALGIGVVELVGSMREFSWIGGHYTLGILATAMGVAIGMGVVGAAYPAWRAVNVLPVEALRYE